MYSVFICNFISVYPKGNIINFSRILLLYSSLFFCGSSDNKKTVSLDCQEIKFFISQNFKVWIGCKFTHTCFVNYCPLHVKFSVCRNSSFLNRNVLIIFTIKNRHFIRRNAWNMVGVINSVLSLKKENSTGFFKL